MEPEISRTLSQGGAAPAEAAVQRSPGRVAGRDAAEVSEAGCRRRAGASRVLCSRAAPGFAQP